VPLAPGLAIASLFVKRNSALVAALPVTLTLGYVSFFLAYYVGRLAALEIAMLVLASIAWLITRWQALERGTATTTALQGFGLAFVISLACVCLVYAADLGIGSWAATDRFAPAIWASDAQLPQIVAEGLYRQLPVNDLIGVGWHVSDRPPLLSGLMLLAQPLFEPFFAVGDNQRLGFLFYQVLGSVACTLWVSRCSTLSKASARRSSPWL
jgi:hypothetical protein